MNVVNDQHIDYILKTDSWDMSEEV